MAGTEHGRARRSPARYVAEGGLIAAAYGTASVLTIRMLGLLAFGPIQFRVSEAFTVLALFTPAAIPGLWLGTVVANAFTGLPFAWLDMALGGLATLLGAWWTWRFRARRALALLGPVVSNALIVPAYLPIILASVGGLGFYTVPGLGWDLSGVWWAMYAFGFVTVGFGQAVVVYGLGWPLAAALERSGITRSW